MKRALVMLGVIGVLLIGSNHADALVIVDTGTPVSSGGPVVGANQWLAAKFSVVNPGYSITDIEGYIFTLTAGDIYVDITTDGGNTPSSSVLYAGNFYANENDDYNWFGIHNIDGFNLGAGNYWVVFKANSPTYVSMPKNPPAPLGDEASSIDQGSSWEDWDSLNIGVKISGNPVPEPATMSLLGVGLLSLLGLRKRSV